jgi:sterol desaturase/sphingolipid hydroxylase (fatty acid hydroxylase superfamily)
MGAFWVHAITEAAHNFARVAWVLPVLTALECLFPRDQITWTSRLRGLTFWTLTIPFAACVASSFGLLREALHIQPLIDLRLAGLLPSWLGIVATPFVISLANDFFIYWYHRAQHALLWRFHGVHHAIEELSSAGSYDHITEELWMTLLKSAPMGFLIGLHNEAYWLIAALISMQGFWVHCNTRLSFGPLRYVLTDNRYHRIHHSIDPEHWNKNFAIFSPFWDVVFGTAYFPRPGEWPATGTPEAPETISALDWIVRPLIRQRRSERIDHRPTPRVVHSHAETDLVGRPTRSR